MKIELEPKAAKYFTEKVASISLEMMPASPSIKVREFESQRFVHGSIDLSKAIRVHPLKIYDVDGNEIGRYQRIDNELVGVGGSDFADYVRFCNSISNIKSIKSVVSEESIRRIVFEYLLMIKAGLAGSFTQHLVAEIEKAVESFDIWIPIHGCEIQSSLGFGKVTFVPILPELFDKSIEKYASEKTQERMKLIEEMIDAQRRATQGLMCGVISVQAEPDLARDIAYQEIEKSLNLLRVFDPSMVRPHLVSQCMLFGRHHLRANKHFTVNAGVIVKTADEMIDVPNTWKITDHDVTRMYELGLANLVRIGSGVSLSEFEQHLSNILVMYTKSSLAHSISDRILYLMTSLECLLLFDDSEPIVHSVSERLAFMIEQQSSKRISVVKNYKAVYKIRSKYVHHGSYMPHGKMEELRELSFNTWRLMLRVIQLSGSIQTKEQLRLLIEKIKYQ